MSNKQKISTEGSVRETWDRVAADYDQQRERDPVYRSCIKQAIAALVKPRTGGIALDAGCGTGMTTLSLAPHFDTVYALDFSLKSLQFLRAKSGASAICSVQADIRKLPFPDEFFEVQ